ncbi:restriction endonuclease subunit S [Parabacteroides distasonis]|uniref:restriction endonuclease subunit S n=1 Tax=Parabacteroides distasonis TaxID=823 RepID=UPI002164337F|nr:restriction endonuclease subunit S [Parabacteroides distasonis]UVR20557.1 restriction endonuclease subunit S [Parabacteroides distasonis]
MKLTRCKLGKVLELQRGYDLPSSQMEKGDILVAGSNGVIGYHNEARSNHPCITVGRSGSVGKVHYYEQATWAHNTALFVKDFKGNDPKYLYYFLKNLHLDKMFDKGSSVVPSLDRKVVHSLNVPCHKDIDCQKRIAAILSKIDRKIELNRAINQNLEAMAKQLYDYWFVQFDFPNEDGKPYKSSGSAMVWNEELKREIPQGWSNMSIGDYAPCKSGYAFKSKDFGGKGLPVIKIGNIQENYTLDMTDSQCIDLFNKTLFLAKRYDLVIAMTGATIGKFAISQSNYWVNQRVGRFDLGDRPLSRLGFLFNSLKQEYFREQVFQIACGCAQPNISAEQIDSISILKPNDVILNQFNKLCEPLLELQSENYLQIEELTKQRDELLPLLMNGQVSVNSDLSAH